MAVRDSARWRAQRWSVDATVQALGIEFDQARVGYYLGPVRDAQAGADMAALRQSIRGLADYLPVIVGRAQLREHRAAQAEAAGHLVTAGAHWFAAAGLWEMAQWPLWETTDELRDLDRRKNAAYARWMPLADHQVERVEIPFDGSSLPGHLHLPPGWDGRPVPTVVAFAGMDAGRFISVARVADENLTRGLAVLAVDGPGQQEAGIRGIHTSPEAWTRAAQALVQWLRARPEVDDSRLVATGTSFGSFAATWVVAHSPGVFRGVGVAMPFFEPGGRTLFEESAPSFKSRHMWMAGLSTDEAAFDQMVAGYDLRGPLTQMTAPWFVVGGTADELSPTAWVERLADACPTPTTTVLYHQARHSMAGSPAIGLGPSWVTELADWVADRALTDDPAPDERREVDRTGAVLINTREGKLS